MATGTKYIERYAGTGENDWSVPVFGALLVFLKRDFQTIFTVDEFSRRLERQSSRLVQDTLSAHRRVDGTLPFPNVGIFRRHFRLVESGMKNAHRNAFGFDFLCQEHGHHVGGGFAHVMTVITTVRGLRGSPRNGTPLRSDHNHLAARRQQTTMDQRGRDPQRTQGTNVNGFELVGKIQGFQRFHVGLEITRIVDELPRR